MSRRDAKQRRCTLCAAPCDGPTCRAHADLTVDFDTECLQLAPYLSTGLWIDPNVQYARPMPHAPEAARETVQ